MVMRPDILLLDEPTSRLDPIAKDAFVSALGKLSSEFGTTVIIAEHCTENLLELSNKVLIMNSGELVFHGDPRQACTAVKNEPVFETFPAAARLWKELGDAGECPLSVNEGKRLLERYSVVQLKHEDGGAVSGSAAINVKNIYYRYEKSLPDVIKNVCFSVCVGEIFTLLGANGCGKTTLLDLISANKRPYKGKIEIFDKPIEKFGDNLYGGTLALLVQEPKALFSHDTVFAELDGRRDLIERFGFERLENRHPYDLSGGEQQKCALAKIMLHSPKILLLDEPTKGMDAATSNEICELIKGLKNEGKTVMIVTHDVELAAKVSDRCALMFDGGLVNVDTPAKFFGENYFYTTGASRIARGKIANVLTVSDIVNCVEK